MVVNAKLVGSLEKGKLSIRLNNNVIGVDLDRRGRGWGGFVRE